MWAQVECKLAEPPSVSDLFDPPAGSIFPWLALYDRDRYLSRLASQSSYARAEPPLPAFSCAPRLPAPRVRDAPFRSAVPLKDGNRSSRRASVADHGLFGGLRPRDR